MSTYVRAWLLSAVCRIDADRYLVAISQCLDHKQLLFHETRSTVWQRSRCREHVAVCFLTSYFPIRTLDTSRT